MAMADRTKKPVSASRVTLQKLMLPEHANAYGNVHGGTIMKIVDEAGAIAAMRHAQRPCVTVAIDSMTFDQPVHVGELLSCQASVNWVGRSSLEVGVRVHAENPIGGRSTHTNSAYLVYVALDDGQQPCAVPDLILETADDQRRFRQADERQQRRLQHKRAR
jgi:acyl-CoA hydrolase